MNRDSIPIAILGFSDFERSALVSCFQLDGQVAQCFEHVLSVEDARFVVVDGDQPGALALVEQLGRPGDALFVGSHAPRQAAGWLMRPLNPAAVLRELRELARQRDNPDSAPLPLPLPWSMGSEFGGLGGLGGPRAAAVQRRPAGTGRRLGERRADERPADEHAPGDAAAARAAPGQRIADLGADLGADSGPMPLSAAARLPVGRPLVVPRALLVDDSDIALHFLQRLLLAYGLAVDVARTSQQALALLADRAYGLVFIDLDLGEASALDGLKLCHQVRHGPAHAGGRVPMVVMVSAFKDPVDQVRGTLAGAEAYLGKPLDRYLLDKLLRRLGFQGQHTPLGTAGGLRPLPPRPPRR